MMRAQFDGTKHTSKTRFTNQSNKRKKLMGKLRLLFIGIFIGLLASAAVSYGVSYGKGPAKRYINLPGKNAQLPFSDGVMIGNTFYLAGRLGTDPKTNQIPSDIEQEIRLLLDGFKTVL